MAALKENISLSKKWEITPPIKKGFYTADAVIDAYLQGKKEGLEQAQKAELAHLDNNIKKATDGAKGVIKFLRSKKIKPREVYLRIDSWYTFNILITVLEKDFLNDSFMEVYDFVNQHEKEVDSGIYHISFAFTDANSELDEKHLRADGFIFRYKNE